MLVFVELSIFESSLRWKLPAKVMKIVHLKLGDFERVGGASVGGGVVGEVAAVAVGLDVFVVAGGRGDSEDVVGRVFLNRNYYCCLGLGLSLSLGLMLLLVDSCKVFVKVFLLAFAYALKGELLFRVFRIFRRGLLL